MRVRTFGGSVEEDFPALLVRPILANQPVRVSTHGQGAVCLFNLAFACSQQRGTRVGACQKQLRQHCRSLVRTGGHTLAGDCTPSTAHGESKTACSLSMA